MSTVDLPPAQPSGPRAEPRSHLDLTDTVSQTLSMAWRALKKMRRNPEQFFDVTMQPLLFTAMFAFIFGGAITGDVQSYLPLMIPGILAQTALTACMATGVQLREDLEKGVFDRFKSLPIARIAPLAGPMIADLVRYAIASTLTFAVGIAIGYRPDGGIGGVVASIVLIIIAGWSLSWAFTFVGTVARSAQAVQGISMMIMFPLTFLSNAFVPEKTLPDWLQVFVKINPVSHVVSAARDLANHGTVSIQVAFALLGFAVIIAIFAPLSVWTYKRKL